MLNNSIVEMFFKDNNPNNMEKIDFYRFLKDFKIEGYEINEKIAEKRLYSTMFNNSKITRDFLLLKLVSHDEYTIFCENGVLNSIKQIPKKTIEIYSELSSVTTQSILIIIGKIHKNHSFLIRIIENMFQNDITEVLSFSYSTFPALYGNFSCPLQCSLAYHLLFELLRYESLLDVVNCMLEVYFSVMFGFYDSLWLTFCSKVITLMGDISCEQIFLVFIDALNSSSCLIEYYHAKLLTDLCENYPERAKKIVIDSIITQSFKLYFNGKRISMTDSVYNIINIVFASISDESYYSRIISSLISLSPEKSLDDRKYLRIPFFMSLNDIELLFLMFKDMPDLHHTMIKIENEKLLKQKNTDLTYFFDIYFSNGVNITALPSNHTVLSREWQKISEKAKLFHSDPIMFSQSFEKGSILSDVLDYGLSMEIEKIRYEYSSLNEILRLMDLKNYHQSLSFAIYALYDTVIYNACNIAISGINLVSGAFQVFDLISLIQGSVEMVFTRIGSNELFPFHMFTSILERYFIIEDDNTQSVNLSFRYCLESNHREFRDKPNWNSLSIESLNRSINCVNNSCDNSLSHIFVSMIDLSDMIDQIVSILNIDWLDVLKFALMRVAHPLFVSSFILLNRIIEDNKSLLSCNHQSLDKWLMFSTKVTIILQSIGKMLETILFDPQF